MIKYDYEITVNGNQAKLNKDIYLFRGNKNVHYYFAVKNASFNFKGSTDLIEKTNAINAAVTVIKPNNVEVASAIAKVENGKIHLKVTEDLIDEEVEVGDFDLVFDLFDDTDGAVTIPKVIGQFHVLERPCTTPISELVATNTTNEVDQALTDYAIVTYAEPVASTNADGTFAKKTWVAKEKITTAELNRMEEGISDVSSQCKDIANNTELNTFDDCIYNRSALKNINNREFFSMVILGDSIGAGTAATDNYGFIQRFIDASYYHQGFIKYTTEYFYYKEATGWTKEENGINLQTISSSNASKEFFGIPNNAWTLPTNDYKVAIVYCKKTDGGQFDVKDNDNKVLTTIDCSGENNLGCISDYFTVGAGKAFKICPKQDNKAYVIAAMIDFQPEKKGYKIINWSVGGRQLCEYTKEELKTMILYDSFDTVYCELFANDSAIDKFDEYFDKLTYLIDIAKANKKDVILNITNRNENYDATEDARANFKKWENKMYEIAKGKNCCLINFDKLIGGHTIGKANGLIADTIHPNDVGHEIMAKLFNFIIFKDSNTYSVNRENSTYPIYGKRHIAEEQYYNATQYFNDVKIRVWDNNGNKNNVTTVMPIIRHWIGPQGYTKFAEEGAIGSTGRLIYINQNGISTQANWQLALTSPFLETVTTIPDVNDGNKNTIFRYRQEGKDDQIIVCVKVNGTEQFKAIQLVDII